MPNHADSQFFVEEFAYIQFSEDFSQVQYGSAEEIEQRRQLRQRMAQ